MGIRCQGTTLNNGKGIKINLENNDIYTMVGWFNGAMVQYLNGEMVKWWYRYIVISCDSIYLGQICDYTRFFYFYKHL